MADNTLVTVGASGDSIRDKDRAGVKTQIVGIDLGIGTATESLMSAANPLPVVDPDATGSGSITATDAVVAAPGGAGVLVSGASTAGSTVALACPGGDSAWNVQITGLTTGTLYWEESLDSTTGVDGNWINVNGRQTGVVNTVLAGNTTTNGVFRGNTSGAKWFRVRAVGALTGTPAVQIRMSAGVGAMFLNASVPAGTNTIGAIRTTDGTNVAAVKAASAAAVAADPALVVALSPSSPMPTAAPAATYVATATIALAALATDVFTLSGSATKTVRITKIVVNGVQTTAGQALILLIKRSTADTGGTSAAAGGVAYDSANAAVTAIALAYTANPITLGTVVGSVYSGRVFLPGAASAADAQGLNLTFADVGQQNLVLRGTAQQLVVNLNGVTVAGGSLNVTVEWTEA